MQTDSGVSRSPWMADLEMPPFATLSENLTTDVIIVGGGIAGISTAYVLSQEGIKVIVIDDGTVGGGETGRTTAHLVNALDDRFYELERLHGERGARLAAESHSAAIDKIESIVQTENIQCDFTRLDGYLFEPPGGNLGDLEREFEAAHRAGLSEVEMVARTPLSFETGPALRFPHQGQFHPLKYLRALALAVERRGGRIFTNTHVAEIQGGKNPSVVTATGFKVAAKAVVVATNTPVNDRVVIHTKQASYRTYVLGLRIPRDSVPLALYWDNADPYHYIRLERSSERLRTGDDLLIVGGEDHKTGQEEGEAPYANLETWVRKRFPMAGPVEMRWSGQIIEPIDSLAFIGKNPLDENVYICTGDSGNGMTHGTIGALLISDLIAGRPNEWEKLYDPKRRTLRAASEFAKENLNVAAQYVDWIKPGTSSRLDEINPSEGAVIREGAALRAVFRDDDNELHVCSAVCPHLGGVVHWNSTEKTWDCPCHGSRFDRFGNVVNGPAIEGLSPLDLHRQEKHHEQPRSG